MPIYEYRCASCGFEAEYLQKVRDPLLTHCPKCSQPTFDKLVSAAGFQLKGSGWYVTDFKNKDKGGKPAADAKASATSDEKSGGTAGDKSAEKRTETNKEEKKAEPASSTPSPAST